MKKGAQFSSEHVLSAPQTPCYMERVDKGGTVHSVIMIIREPYFPGPSKEVNFSSNKEINDVWIRRIQR